MTDKLTDAIDQLVQEKTFKLDALEAIGKLRTRAAQQEQEIARLIAECHSRDQVTRDLRGRLQAYGEQESALAVRETKVAEREAKVQQLEVEKAVAQAESRAYGTVFNTIFRNTIFRNTAVREHVMRNEMQWVHGPSGPMQVPVHDHKTYERTAE